MPVVTHFRLGSYAAFVLVTTNTAEVCCFTPGQYYFSELYYRDRFVPSYVIRNEIPTVCLT
jgi:glutathione peroxidase-family protein